MLPREAYRALRRTPANVPTGQNPSDLLPTFAKRLDSSEVLVVNGANGTFFGNPNQNFTGEIVLLNGDTTQTQPDKFNPSALNLGFSSLSIRLVLPPIIGTRGLVNPIFADRR